MDDPSLFSATEQPDNNRSHEDQHPIDGLGHDQGDVRYAGGDGLVFGNESSGAPAWLHEEIGAAQRVTIPHANPDLRSLNLSTAAGVAAYEALRQIGMPKG